MRAIEEAVQNELRHDQRPVTLFMLGGVDVGKTYTVTALANRFYEQGFKVAVVDADVGQSDVGPPCCIGMGMLARRIQKLSEVPLHSLYFVGNTSPYGSMHECVEGAVAAVREAEKRRADLILVDSTGWIEGEEARIFKLFEIRALKPSFVVAIEKEDELGHILPHLNRKVIRLQRSPETKSRTREERKALREEAYNNYFRAAQDRVFELALLTWHPEIGTLLGLLGRSCAGDDEGNEILGLGILRELDYDRGKAVVCTPVDTQTGATVLVTRIKPGRVKLIKVNGGYKEFKSLHI
jgi:polynucleotide 5'-hydroxyl-kinase GRC3/NOL9